MSQKKYDIHPWAYTLRWGFARHIKIYLRYVAFPYSIRLSSDPVLKHYRSFGITVKYIVSWSYTKQLGIRIVLIFLNQFRISFLSWAHYSEALSPQIESFATNITYVLKLTIGRCGLLAGIDPGPLLPSGDMLGCPPGYRPELPVIATFFLFIAVFHFWNTKLLSVACGLRHARACIFGLSLGCFFFYY